VIDLDRGAPPPVISSVPIRLQLARLAPTGSELNALAGSIESRPGYVAGVSAAAPAELNDYGSATKFRLRW